MNVIVLRREDFGNPDHPWFWEELLETLGIQLPESRDDYPDEAVLRVSSAWCP